MEDYQRDIHWPKMSGSRFAERTAIAIAKLAVGEISYHAQVAVSAKHPILSTRIWRGRYAASPHKRQSLRRKSTPHEIPVSPHAQSGEHARRGACRLSNLACAREADVTRSTQSSRASRPGTERPLAAPLHRTGAMLKRFPSTALLSRVTLRLGHAHSQPLDRCGPNCQHGHQQGDLTAERR